MTNTQIEARAIDELVDWEFLWNNKKGVSPFIDISNCSQLNNWIGTKKFTVLHFNVRSLPRNISLLTELLMQLTFKGIIIDALLICETFLNNVNSKFYQIKGTAARNFYIFTPAGVIV